MRLNTSGNLLPQGVSLKSILEGQVQTLSRLHLLNLSEGGSPSDYFISGAYTASTPGSIHTGSPFPSLSVAPTRHPQLVYGRLKGPVTVSFSG